MDVNLHSVLYGIQWIKLMWMDLNWLLFFTSQLLLWYETKKLKNMGNIWFFNVLLLLPIRFTQENACCIRKSTMKHMQKPDRKSNLSYFTFGYQKCVFVDFLTRHICALNCVHYLSVKKLLVFENAVQSLFNTCVFMTFVL